MTNRQNKLMTFLRRYIAENATSPSFEELRVALGLASKSGVSRIVADLIDRGLLVREGRGSVRALALPEPLVGSVEAHSTEVLTTELRRRGFAVTADLPVQP